MSDDDRPGHRVSGGHAQEADVVEPVVLPEHASAYYSPRAPPVATSHQTLEIAAVKLDPSVDPRLADTHRVSIDGLEPPPWLSGPGPVSDAPTVLLPIVRARRLRRRALAALAVALIGAGFGIWFGLTSELGSSMPSLPKSASVAPLRRSETASLPPVAFSVPAAVPAPVRPAPSPRAAPAPSASTSRARGAPRGVASAAPAWFKSEPPKAWIK
jgi:hypothetical protein